MRQSEDLYRDRKDPGTLSIDSNGKRRVGSAKLPGNANKKRVISGNESQGDGVTRRMSHKEMGTIIYVGLCFAMK